MGLRVIIKGADFSANNLGKYNPTVIGSDRFNKFITKANEGMSDINLLSFDEKKALKELDEGITSLNLWSKIHALFPLIGKTSQQIKLNLKDADLNPIVGDINRQGRSFIPNNNNCGLTHDFSMQKNFGVIIYNNKPADALPTGIASLFHSSSNTFTWWQYVTSIHNVIQFDQGSIQTVAGVELTGVDILQKQGLLAGFARSDKQYAYKDLAEINSSSYNSTYLDTADKYGSVINFGRDNTQGISFLAFTSALNDSEYSNLGKLIKTFLSKTGGL